MAIATAAQLKEFLGVVGAGDDALIGRLVTGAEQFFYMLISRQTLEVSPFTQTLNGTGKDYILTSHWPLLSITSLVVDSSLVAPSLYTIGEESTLDSRMIYLTRASGLVFPKGRRNVVVSGTFGYATMPAEIVQAVLEIAARAYQKRKRIDETSKQINGETVSYSVADLTDFAKRVVNNYTNRVPL